MKIVCIERWTAVATQESVRETAEGEAGRTVRSGLRPAALRHHQHVLRGRSGSQSARAAGIFAGSSSGLQAGEHCAGGEPLRDAAGLLGLRRQTARCLNAGTDRGVHGRTAWPGRARLGDGLGVAREKNGTFLREGGRRYLLGTGKNALRKFERELLPGLKASAGRAGGAAGSDPGGEEVFILCRSGERQAKEQAMQERFEKRIEDGLVKIAGSCDKRRAEIGYRGASRRTAAGTKHTGPAIVRRAGGGGCPGLHATALEQGGESAAVGAPD